MIWNADCLFNILKRKINLAYFLLACREGQFNIYFLKYYHGSVCSGVGSEQTKLPSVVSFQARWLVYVGTGPRLTNSSQVMVISSACGCISLGDYRTVLKVSVYKTLRGDVLC